MEKFNHDDSDFLTALGLDKEEIMKICQLGLNLHLLKGLSKSKCIVEMTKAIKKKGMNMLDDDIKMFAVGMVFAETLSVMKRKNDMSGIMKDTISRIKKYMPFTADDVRKSIKDELESKSKKKDK